MSNFCEHCKLEEGWDLEATYKYLTIGIRWILVCDYHARKLYDFARAMVPLGDKDSVLSDTPEASNG